MKFDISAVSDGASVLALDRRVVRRAVQASGRDLLKGARARLRKKSGGGRLYYGSGGANSIRPYLRRRYAASAEGEAPVRVTGTLARSLKLIVWRDGLGATAAARAFYALFLENTAKGRGRRVLSAHPVLSAAAAAQAPSIEARLSAAAIAAVGAKK